MVINRNNYEEYFLLYADNELSGSEKEVVEAFVRRNMDLESEFLITQLTVISPDQDVKLDDKSFLLKEDTGFITENNHEEIFILYHDNELTDQQKKETELFAEQNLNFKKALEWFGKSKLIPDEPVIYPLKNQLYKKERRATIIILNRMKIIAAAVFIGFGTWLLSSYFNQDPINSPSASLSKTIIKEAAKEKSVEKKNADIHLPVKKMDNTSELAQIENSKNNEKGFNRHAMKPDLMVIKKTAIKNQKNDKQTVKISATKTQPGIHLQLATPNDTLEEISNTLTRVKNELQNVTVAKQIYDIKSEVHDKPVTQTLYNNTSNEGHDYVFYDISAEEFRRSKVGGLLKKIKRVVERSNPITRLLALSEERFTSKN